jgi:hypothetical protein
MQGLTTRVTVASAFTANWAENRMAAAHTATSAALNNAWNQSVLDYGQTPQNKLLRKLGMAMIRREASDNGCTATLPGCCR